MKKVLNISLIRKMIKNRPLCTSFPKMSAYRSFDKNNSMYLMIKEEKIFSKYNEIQEKLSNIIKKLIVKLYTIKNIYMLKKNKHKRKRKLLMFLYTSNID